jgi:hypothetical protein
MTDSLNKQNGVLNKNRTSLIKTILAERPSATLFHYTSQAGLLGILKTRSFWASNIHYMNDASEFSYATQRVRAALQAALKDAQSPRADVYATLLKQIGTVEGAHVFAVSLSEEGDLLSQWRGYCPDGGGYSLGFGFETLIEPMKRNGFRLVKCLYRVHEHETVVRELVQSALRRVADCPPLAPEWPARLESTAQEFIRDLLFVGPAIKHTTFFEEREWRLVAGPVPINHSSIKFRCGKNALIPYFDLKIASDGDPLEVAQINIGPNPHVELATRSVVDLITVLGVKCQAVVQSRVPYRGS